MARKRIITPEKKELIRNLISELQHYFSKGFAGSIEGSARRYDTKYVGSRAG